MKFLSYLLSPFFFVTFFLILIVFHPLQWLGLKISQNSHQNVVNIMNWFINKALLILGINIKFINKQTLPENETIIFVSNHQSMFDIPPIIWHLRKHYPKFVSKIELGKGIPSISFNLRHGGAALINRKDATQAIKALNNFAIKIAENKWSAVIFPEGTRSRDGKPKSFSKNGLKTILKHNSDALIVPITINNSWKIFKYDKFPFGVFSPLVVKVHKPIKASSLPFEELVTNLEVTIKKDII